MPTLRDLQVVQSAIHGYGIVTERPFRAGEVVIFGDGILYHENDDFDDTYALVYSDEHDPAGEVCRYYDLTCQTRWINHSCNPNTEVDTGIDPNTGRPIAWWTAVRDIPVGEELSYDYAFSGHLAEPCNCGAANCRGLIVDEDEMHLVPPELQHLAKRNALRAC
jgi:SET domain-containing protein